MLPRYLFLGALTLLAATDARASVTWQSQGVVAPGRQFSAVADDTRLHIVARSYVQVQADGTVELEESDVSDGRQNALDYYPAIAVGADGAVHVVTRHGGDFGTGHEIRYTRRAPGGGWGAPIVVSPAVPRNYVVDVAAPSGGRILVAHTVLLEDVNGAMDVYEISGTNANKLGTTPRGWQRVDADFRLATSGNAVALASGTPGPNDPFHFSFAADASGDLVAQWQATHTGHSAGQPRRSGPAMHVDDAGDIHVVYGGRSAHYYARYTASGDEVRRDVETMNDLGTWHLSYGNGAVVASADGERVIAIALQNLDGDDRSDNAEILCAESVDGGATFAAAEATGLRTDGGEGRMRPRLARIGDTLLLAFYDRDAGGIAVATADWEDAGGTTGTAGTTGTSGTTGPAESTGSTGSGSGSTTGSGGVTETDTAAPSTATGLDDSGATNAANTEGTGGLDTGTTAFTGRGRSEGDGCGCRSRNGRNPAPWFACALLALAFRHRRSPLPTA